MSSLLASEDASVQTDVISCTLLVKHMCRPSKAHHTMLVMQDIAVHDSWFVQTPTRDCSTHWKVQSVSGQDPPIYFKGDN